MMSRYPFTGSALLILALGFHAHAQNRPGDPVQHVRDALIQRGFFPDDVQDLVLRDAYVSAHNGVRHSFVRQRWAGIEVFNGDVALHQASDGRTLAIHVGAWPQMAKRVNTTEPRIAAADALARVLAKTAPGLPMPRLTSTEEAGLKLVYDGTFHGREPVVVQACFVAVGDSLRLAWNINHYTPDGSHWWNVRIDAVTGDELERNDWVSQCAFDHGDEAICAHASLPEYMAPANPNDYNVFDWPVESPSHGPRTLANAPWTLGGIASPFGWHDTDGVAGADYTDTRGNNCRAQEDQDANNSGGFRPDGGADLDFDFPIDLAQAPVTYQEAAITNLFHWNNVIHDVWYQYGFDEVSGNFQENNYGRGGAAGDFVWADALDGSGTNNANFGTPPDGSNPRMQMFVWTQTSPHRTSDLDNGVIAHEYGHGVSNRTVGGPSNVDCLWNAEQMGEGWSDYLGLVMTMKPGDTGSMPRGIGTYLLGQPTTGPGIRPAPYSTNFGVNNFTYAATNSGSISQPHGIGFIWCTMLWEMTWDLIAVHGFDPDIYNGTGGNNIAMQLVLDGLKLTACNPGFVDGRNAILLADQINYGGANQELIWGAFARRGLGASASQGSTGSRFDQVEAFDMPVDINVGVAQVLSPLPGEYLECAATSFTVVARVRNFGMMDQEDVQVAFSIDGDDPVIETIPGIFLSGSSIDHEFSVPAVFDGLGPHTIQVFTLLEDDELPADDMVSVAITLVDGLTGDLPFAEGLDQEVTTPPGWSLENLDNGTTWTNLVLDNGPLCEPSRVWRIDHYYYNASGQEDRLVTPLVDLSNAVGTKLHFDHAYRAYSNFYADAFRIDVSVDCGATWEQVFYQATPELATGSNIASPWVPTDCNQWRNNEVDLSDYDGEVVRIRFVAINGYGNRFHMDNVAVESSGARIALKLFLEGAFDAQEGLMRNDLRAASMMPETEPYSALGFDQVLGGGETISTGLVEPEGDDALVDWVLLELRDADDPTVVVATRSLLLQRDGDVVDPSGASAIALPVLPGEYHVAMRHRNHLGCMTAGPLQVGAEPELVDMSSPALPTFGTDARTTVNGLMMLRSGNVITNGTIKYTGSDNDRDPILQAIGGNVPTAVVNGYYQEDLNLDGAVKYTGADNDRDRVLLSVGGNVPTAVRVEQLP